MNTVQVCLLVLGYVLGGGAGVLIFALCAAARFDDIEEDEHERHHP